MNVVVNADRITAHQVRHCMTRSELSESSGVGICAVKRLGNSRYISVSVKTLKKLADCLGFAPAEVIAEPEELEAYKTELMGLINTEQNEKTKATYERRLAATERITAPAAHA